MQETAQTMRAAKTPETLEVKIKSTMENMRPIKRPSNHFTTYMGMMQQNKKNLNKYKDKFK